MLKMMAAPLYTFSLLLLCQSGALLQQVYTSWLQTCLHSAFCAGHFTTLEPNSFFDSACTFVSGAVSTCLSDLLNGSGPIAFHARTIFWRRHVFADVVALFAQPGWQSFSSARDSLSSTAVKKRRSVHGHCGPLHTKSSRVLVAAFRFFSP